MEAWIIRLKEGFAIRLLSNSFKNMEVEPLIIVAYLVDVAIVTSFYLIKKGGIATTRLYEERIINFIFT